MTSRLHRCPQCQTTGKVHRSKTRGFSEKLRLRLLPMYAVYRCHNCNWRGWLMRSTASPMMSNLILGVYFGLMVMVVLGAIYFIIRHWPSAKYKY